MVASNLLSQESKYLCTACANEGERLFKINKGERELIQKAC